MSLENYSGFFARFIVLLECQTADAFEKFSLPPFIAWFLTGVLPAMGVSYFALGVVIGDTLIRILFAASLYYFLLAIRNSGLRVSSTTGISAPLTLGIIES